MSLCLCAARLHPANQRSTPKTKSAQVPKPPEIGGTWDFKWEQGAEIVVACQRLPRAIELELDLFTEDLLEEAERIANLWIEKSGANVSFKFLEDLTDEPPAGSARSPSLGKVERYDVLLSLASLPLEEPASEQLNATTVRLNTSCLGTYARRVWSGVATTYLGMREHFPGGVQAYFGKGDAPFSDELTDTILHEFGHILGLVHAHQHPDVELPWKPADKITDLLKRAVGDVLSEAQWKEFVTSEIIEPWPVARNRAGEVVFSDLPDRPVGNVVESCVSNPIYKCLLQGADAGCISPEGDCDCPEFYGVPPAPDVAYLRRLYPPKAAVAVLPGVPPGSPGSPGGPSVTAALGRKRIKTPVAAKVTKASRPRRR